MTRPTISWVLQVYPDRTILLTQQIRWAGAGSVWRPMAWSVNAPGDPDALPLAANVA